jgi:hypothetical protein
MWLTFECAHVTTIHTDTIAGKLLQPDDIFILVRFEVFTAITMKNAVFWDIKPSSYLIGDT